MVRSGIMHFDIHHLLIGGLVAYGSMERRAAVRDLLLNVLGSMRELLMNFH